VFRETTWALRCQPPDEVSVRGQKKSVRVREAHHVLDAYVVDDIICIAGVNARAYASVDDFLKVRERRTHPVAGRGEIVVHVSVSLLPRRLRADFGRHRRALEIEVERRRIWVRIWDGHVIYIPSSCEWREDVCVAEVLGIRAIRVAPPIITCYNLCRHECV